MTSGKNFVSQSDWDDLLKAAAAFQRILPDGVVVGGTAAALHAKHRFSNDADFVLGDLKDRFAQLLDDIERVSGWTTARSVAPKVILGSFEGIQTGIRQLKRTRPLETISVATKFGDIRVPTLEEIIRIKGWLILDRNKMRDYLDFVALCEHAKSDVFLDAMRKFDAYYADMYKPGERNVSPLLQLVRQLAQPLPSDGFADLPDYKGVSEDLRNADILRAKAASISAALYIDFRATKPAPGAAPPSRPSC